MIRNLIKRVCYCLFPPKDIEIDEEMYLRILEYRNSENKKRQEIYDDLNKYNVR